MNSASHHRPRLGRLSPSTAGACWLVVALFASACLPSRDLDATAAGSRGSGVSGEPNAGTSAAGAQSTGGAGDGGSSSSGSSSSAAGEAGEPSEGGAATFSSAGASDGGSSLGGSSLGGASASGAGGSQALGNLVSEMNDSPVTGSVQFASDASWQVNGATQSAFEINTPTATYFLVKKLGMIVSLTGAVGSSRHEWISYSDSFRPHRGLPNLGTCCEADAKVSLDTTLDMTSVTPGHVRLDSNSTDNGWALVWDFYRTHVTLTVNHAPQAFSFGYRGTPGGSLDSADRFVTSAGQSYPALSSVFDQAFDGAAQWAYLADDGDMHSLFLVQHSADALADHYGVDKADTAVLLFGAAGGILAPLRFSFGLVDSTDQAVVAARVKYVVDVTH